MEKNRAFLIGDAVGVYFFVRNKKLIMTEECYFFLMASMRKMRMNIPISFTLEYFTDILEQKIIGLTMSKRNKTTKRIHTFHDL